MGLKSHTSFYSSLIKDVASLLEIRAEALRFHPKGADRVVRAIFTTIKEALKRNEEVNIPGLGVFSLWERPHTKHGVTHFYNQKRGMKKQHPKPQVGTFPPKTYVHFKPDPSIIKELNANRESGE